MANLLVQKPSRVDNVSYLFLGYYLSSLVAYQLDLPVDQKILLVATIGSLIGTLVYYIKPVERAISAYYRLSKKNDAFAEIGEDERIGFHLYKSDILYSSYLQDDRTIINGAFFLAVGMLTSYSLLALNGLVNLYWLLVALSGVLICVGCWEVYQLIHRKMSVVNFFYTYYNHSQNIPLLEAAIKKKDWTEAERIMEKEPELIDPEIYYEYFATESERGICVNCNEIREGAFCCQCGTKVLTNCKDCSRLILRNFDKQAPKYCRYCGSKIEPAPEET